MYFFFPKARKLLTERSHHRDLVDATKHEVIERLNQLKGTRKTQDPQQTNSTIFKRADSNGDGTLDKTELRKLLRECSKERFIWDEVVSDIFKELDHDRNGMIDQSEFEEWVASHDKNNPSGRAKAKPRGLQLMQNKQAASTQQHSCGPSAYSARAEGKGLQTRSRQPSALIPREGTNLHSRIQESMVALDRQLFAHRSDAPIARSIGVLVNEPRIPHQAELADSKVDPPIGVRARAKRRPEDGTGHNDPSPFKITRHTRSTNVHS